jgi:hypothetical protein
MQVEVANNLSLVRLAEHKYHNQWLVKKEHVQKHQVMHALKRIPTVS